MATKPKLNASQKAAKAWAKGIHILPPSELKRWDRRHAKNGHAQKMRDYFWAGALTKVAALYDVDDDGKVLGTQGHAPNQQLANDVLNAARVAGTYMLAYKVLKPLIPYEMGEGASPNFVGRVDRDTFNRLQPEIMVKMRANMARAFAEADKKPPRAYDERQAFETWLSNCEDKRKLQLSEIFATVWQVAREHFEDVSEADLGAEFAMASGWMVDETGTAKLVPPSVLNAKRAERKALEAANAQTDKEEAEKVAEAKRAATEAANKVLAPKQPASESAEGRKARLMAQAKAETAKAAEKAPQTDLDEITEEFESLVATG